MKLSARFPRLFSIRRSRVLTILVVFILASILPPAGPANAVPTVVATINVGMYPNGITIDPTTNRAYVANYGSDSVSVIDLATNTVIDTVNVGDSPTSVAVDSEAHRLYVTNNGDNTVSVVNTDTHSVVATVSVGLSPQTVVVQPTLNRAYVANGRSNTVSIIDTNSNAVIGDINVGSGQAGLAIHPTTNYLYVVNHVPTSAVVTVVDLATNGIVTTVGVGSYPTDIVIHPSTQLAYVTNASSDTVSVIDTVTNSVVTTIGVGDFPIEIDINPGANRAYVTNYYGDSFSIIDTAINALIASVNTGTDPVGVAVHPSTGRIYVANNGNNTVSVFEDDVVFLDSVAEDTWRYLSSDWATDNHLPWSWRSASMTGGDYANPAEIGLYMLSYLAAYDMARPWSPSWAAVEAEVSATLSQLEAWQNGADAYQNGVFYQWYWLNPTPRVGDGYPNHDVPSIDNAILAASLITIREYAGANSHPALAQQADGILQDMEFNLWYDQGRHQFSLLAPNSRQHPTWADYYSNENRLINFVARAMGQLSTAEFQASLNALAQPSATYDRGNADPADDITVNRAAWDGSYFTYTAPALFIREMETTYSSTTINPATQAQIAYAQDRGYAAWGLSDSFDVGAGEYVQQGAPPLAPGNSGSPETQPGLVTPHASALALITSYRDQALANLQTLQSTFSAVYDPNYGFRESVMANPGAANYGAVSERFSALAQEWLFLAIANDRTGFIWNYFYHDPGVAASHTEMYGPLP